MLVFIQFHVFYKLLGIKSFRAAQDMAASSVAILHSTTVCVVAYEVLSTQGWAPFVITKEFDLASQNTRAGVATMIFTNSYMVSFALVKRRGRSNEFCISHPLLKKI